MVKAKILFVRRDEKKITIGFVKDIAFINLFLELPAVLKYKNHLEEFPALWKDEKIVKRKLLATDASKNYKARGVDIDFVFGSKQVFVILHAVPKVIDNFMEKVNSMSEWNK